MDPPYQPSLLSPPTGTEATSNSASVTQASRYAITGTKSMSNAATGTKAIRNTATSTKSLRNAATGTKATSNDSGSQIEGGGGSMGALNPGLITIRTEDFSDWVSAAIQSGACC